MTCTLCEFPKKPIFDFRRRFLRPGSEGGATLEDFFVRVGIVIISGIIFSTGVSNSPCRIESSDLAGSAATDFPGS